MTAQEGPYSAHGERVGLVIWSVDLFVRGGLRYDRVRTTYVIGRRWAEWKGRRMVARRNRIAGYRTEHFAVHGNGDRRA